jgi:hypothetical protein
MAATETDDAPKKGKADAPAAEPAHADSTAAARTMLDETSKPRTDESKPRTDENKPGADPSRTTEPRKPENDPAKAGLDSRSPDEAIARNASVTLFGEVSQSRVIPQRGDACALPNGFPEVQMEQTAAPARRLDDKTLEKAAEQLHEAINKKSGLIFKSDDPDKAQIEQILKPLGEADRKRLEEVYHSKYDQNGPADTLRKELKDKLGGPDSVDFRKVEAHLNQTDGKTNDAGALMVAITDSKQDQSRGNASIRAVFSTLNADQIKQLDDDFKKAYGTSYKDALNGANLNDATRASLPILEKGVDRKSTEDIVNLANIAVEKNDRQLFAETMRSNTPEAQAARQQLQKDEGFKDKLANAFPSGLAQDPEMDTSRWSFDMKVDPVAKDYLMEGRISLATITSANTGGLWGNNEENVSLAARNATPQERQQYQRGMDLASKDPASLSAEQKADLDFYNKTHDAFKRGGNERQVAIWEDQLVNGKDTMITDLAKTHSDGGWFGIGKGTNMNDAMTRVEKMNADEFKQLQDPKYYDQFMKSLRSYSDDGEYNRIKNMVDAKLATGDFAKSQEVHRSLSETIKDNTGSVFLGMGTSYNGKNILENIQHLSKDDAQKYKTDENFRKTVKDIVDNKLSDEEKMLAHRLLDQVEKTGQPADAKNDPLAKFLHDKINGADNRTMLNDAQAMLKADPALRERLADPNNQNPEDLTLRRNIQSAVWEGYNKTHPPMPSDGYYGLGDNLDFNRVQCIANELIKTGELSVQSKFDLDFPKSDIIQSIASAPEAEQQQYRNQLKPEEQKVLDSVLSNPDHKLSMADKMRLFTIGSEGNASDFATQLDKMHKDGNFNSIQDLKDEYNRKYAGNLNTDLLSKVPEAEKSKYTELLTPSNGDGRQTFYDNMERLLKQTGVTADGTGLTLQRSVDQMGATLEQYQKLHDKLPRETQQALDEYFNKALEQNRQSKEKLAELASTALITAAALTAIVASGGTATPLVLGAAFMAGGITKNLVSMGIQGNDFDRSAVNIAKMFASGGFLAASNFVGGEFLGFGKTLATVGDGVAANVVKDVGTNLITKQSERAIAEALPQMLARNGGRLADGEALQLAGKVLPATASDAEKAAVARAIEQNLSTQAGTINKLVSDPKWLQVMRGAAETGVTGGTVNAGMTAVDSVLNGKPIDPKLMAESALAGFAFGTVLHLGFSGASAAGKYFKVSKEADGLRSAADNQVVKRGDDYIQVNKGEALQKGDVPVAEVPAGAKVQRVIEPNSQNVNVRLNENASTIARDVQGKVSGAGTLEVAGSKSKLEIEVPEGQTMRIVVKEGTPDITVSPNSKGKIEVLMQNGNELPPGLRAYKDATAENPRVQMLDRADLEPRGPVNEQFRPLTVEEQTARLGQIENRLRQQSEAVPLQEFNKIFDAPHDFGDGRPPRPFTPEERKIAMEIMEQSAPNMNSRAVDQQMRDLAEQMKKRGLDPKKDTVVVYTADNASDGAALSHLYAKNSGQKIEIRTLDADAVKTLETKVQQIKEAQSQVQAAEQALQAAKTAEPKDGQLIQQRARELNEKKQVLTGGPNKPGLLADLPQHALVFDDMSKMTPQQRQVLTELAKIQKNLTVVDNGFARGMNMYDFAVTAMTGESTGMGNKMAQMVKEVEQLKAQGLTDKEAVSRYLSSAPSDLPPQSRFSTRQQMSDAQRQVLDSTNLSEAQKIEALYKHATQPLASKEQLQQYLGEIEARFNAVQEQRRLAGLDPLNGTAEAYRTAALFSLERSAHFNDYPTMVRQMQQLDHSIKANLQAQGLKGDDFILVTGLEKDGSSYLANHLYAKATGVPPERIMSTEQLRRLAENPAEAEKILGNKRLVFLDDYKNSGQQQSELLAKFQQDVLSKLHGTNNQPLVQDVIMANLAKHDLPAGTPDPINYFSNGSLFHVEPGATAPAPDGALRVHSISGEHYAGFMDPAVLQRRGILPYKDLLDDMGSLSMFTHSPVASGVITPYGMPNNNPRYMSLAEQFLNIPRRYRVIDLFTQPGDVRN